VGVDWAEDHHDICVMAEEGAVLSKRRVPDSVVGIGDLHGLIAEHAMTSRWSSASRSTGAWSSGRC
jgi:hypothetical protein